MYFAIELNSDLAWELVNEIFEVFLFPIVIVLDCCHQTIVEILSKVVFLLNLRYHLHLFFQLRFIRVLVLNNGGK